LFDPALYQRVREGDVRHLAAMSGDLPCNPAVNFPASPGRGDVAPSHRHHALSFHAVVTE
jgi:hypothetical protein